METNLICFLISVAPTSMQKGISRPQGYRAATKNKMNLIMLITENLCSSAITHCKTFRFQFLSTYITPGK